MKDKLKKYLLPNLPYLFFVYLFDKLCQTVRLAPGLDASEKLLHIGQGFQTAFSSSAPSFHALDICVGILGAVFVRLAVYVKGKNAKKYRKGMEYGSARWGTAADIAPYIDPVPDWNIPLTRTESLTMTSRPKDPKTARNKNILVIGGSGSGKTRFFVKPSIMQMHSSYVITGPKGQLLKETGKMLLHGAPKLDENGKPVRDSRGKVIYEPYRIKVLNTINFSKSMKYNPLAYVRSEKDTLLSAMENAGKEDTPEDAERKGLGTPATRAAIIEKLVTAGFVERKGKNLIPTKAGINLVTVLPEPLTSPMLTAEWEQKLTEIAKGGADPDTFMDGIRTMVQEIVSTYSCISEDGKKLFAPEKEVIGTCPRCGQPVYEGKKNFACSDRSCGFVLWKNDRFWTSRKKELTKKMAADLLKKGRTNVKGMWSEKKESTYDAAVILDDTGGKYINFKLEFPKNKRS